MRRMMVFLLLTLLAIPMYSQQSSAASSDYTICFTESEWAEFEAEAQKILEETALEAAREAVKPYAEREQEWQRRECLWKWAAGILGVVDVFLLGMTLYHYLNQP